MFKSKYVYFLSISLIFIATLQLSTFDIFAEKNNASQIQRTILSSTANTPIERINGTNIVTRIELQQAKSGAPAKLSSSIRSRVQAKTLTATSSSLSSPQSPEVIDPDLEPGFPVFAANTTGSFHGGPALCTVVGNIDTDPQLEILTTALGRGPIYAWNHNGTLVSGWPKAGPRTTDGIGYLTLGRLHDPEIASIFSAFYGGSMAAYAGDGGLLKKWPKLSANFIGSPASLADIDHSNNGGLRPGLINIRDEIFVEEEDWKLHGYDFYGNPLPGWPVESTIAGQERHTPAIADLDNDGIDEIVSASGRYGETIKLFAYHADGSNVSGFPVNIGWGFVDTYPAIGDVDNDGIKDIVLVKISNTTTIPVVAVYNANGTLKWQSPIDAFSSIVYGAAPALADLNNDRIPEIIIQTDESVYVFRGNGQRYPGFPKLLSYEYWAGNSAPVVGDVDGDGQQDIVVAAQLGGQGDLGFLYALRSNGTILPNFPKQIATGAGTVPAIADIDLDGRNEIIVCADYWNGVSGDRAKCWAYDLHGAGPYGHVEWGQFGGNEAHQGVYPPPRLFCQECM